MIDPRDVFTVEQVLAIVAAAKESTCDGTLIYVAAFTGLRRGEVFGLRRRNVDLDAGHHTVAEQLRTPTRKSEGEPYHCPPKCATSRRTSPIAPEVAAVLRGYLAGRLFNPDEPIFLRPERRRLRRNQCSTPPGRDSCGTPGWIGPSSTSCVPYSERLDPRRAGRAHHRRPVGHASAQELAPCARLWPDADEWTPGSMSALIASGSRSG